MSDGPTEVTELAIRYSLSLCTYQVTEVSPRLRIVTGDAKHHTFFQGLYLTLRKYCT